MFWEDLAELKCLAVAEDAQGHGVGRRLVDARWDAARELEIKTGLHLTYAVGFFEKSGYHRIDKAELPHKIWNECVRCPLFPSCQEVALIRTHQPEPILVARPWISCQPRRKLGQFPAQPGPGATSAPTMISPTRRLACSSVLVAIATLGLMLATEPKMAIVWDEGYTLGREARLRAWFRALRDPGGFAARWTPPTLELVQQVGAPPPRPEQIDTRSKLLFNLRVLAYFWPFARQEPHGHPPFYALLGLVGDLHRSLLARLASAAAGPDPSFQPDGRSPFPRSRPSMGALGRRRQAAAWVFQPNLFGHGHYATYDAVLGSLWVLAILFFAGAVIPANPTTQANRSRWAVAAFALVVGCGFATKLTGWFLPLPFLAWAVWRRDYKAIRVLIVAIPLACVVLLLLNPPWWTEPITGAVRFLRSNLTRGQTIPIPVQFLGTIYKTPNQSLPWYNTLAWTVMVTPVGFLVLAMAGIYRAIRDRQADPLGLLILGNWLFLVVLRALPHTPGHDGVRLFLPAFGMLALLVGLGTRQLLDGIGSRHGSRSWPPRLKAWPASCSSCLCRLPISARSWEGFRAIPPGDGADLLLGQPRPEARSWLRQSTGPGQTIQFATFPTSWLYLRRIGELPPGWPHSIRADLPGTSCKTGQVPGCPWTENSLSSRVRHSRSRSWKCPCSGSFLMPRWRTGG